MRHLLDFLYEHSIDKVIYCVLSADEGELELTWRAVRPELWELKSSAGVEEVERDGLLHDLTRRGADVQGFEREMGSLVAAHVVVADHVLRAARSVLGAEGVQFALRAQQDFVRELRTALEPLRPPRLHLVR